MIAAEKQLVQMQALQTVSLSAATVSGENEPREKGTKDTKQLVLTPLGSLLAVLPCSPRIGRMAIFGTMLGCCFPATYAAACMLCKSPFLSVDRSSSGVSQQELFEKQDVILVSIMHIIYSTVAVYVVLQYASR